MRYQIRFVAAAAGCAALLLGVLPVHAQKEKAETRAKTQAENARVFAREMNKIAALETRMKKRFSPAQMRAFRVEEIASEKRAAQEAGKRYPGNAHRLEQITLQGHLQDVYRTQLQKKWRITDDEWMTLYNLSSPE